MYIQLGTFNTMIGAIDEGNCTSCPPGTYSMEVARTTATDCQKCPAGTYRFYSKGTSASMCLACPAGLSVNFLYAFSCLFGSKTTQTMWQAPTASAGRRRASRAGTACSAQNQDPLIASPRRRATSLCPTPSSGARTARPRMCSASMTRCGESSWDPRPRRCARQAPTAWAEQASAASAGLAQLPQW